MKQLVEEFAVKSFEKPDNHAKSALENFSFKSFFDAGKSRHSKCLQKSLVLLLQVVFKPVHILNGRLQFTADLVQGALTYEDVIDEKADCLFVGKVDSGALCEVVNA